MLFGIPKKDNLGDLDVDGRVI